MKWKYKGMNNANGGESSVAKNNRTTTTPSNGQPAGRTKKLGKSNDQHQQHHRSNNSTPTPTPTPPTTTTTTTTTTSSTKIKLFINTGNSWKSLLRDILTAFVPLFVIYKISTHPAVSNIGYVDPTLPKKQTPQELLLVFSWKKKQEELRKELLFLQAMNVDRQCYHVPGPIHVGDMPVTTNQNNKRKRGMQRRGRGVQRQGKITTKGQNNKPRGKNNQHNKGIFYKKMTKKKKHRAPSSSSSSAAPWTVRIASTFSGNPITLGSDTIKGKDSTKEKKSGRRAVKKKYGSKVR